MVSLLTNNSAMVALRSLQATQRELDRVQRQASSGLRVADASDNATSWSIAVTMRSRVEALNATNDGLGLMQATQNTAQAGLKSVLTNLDKIQQDMVAAGQPGVDLAAIQQDISARQTGIRGALGNSSFNGVNLLDTVNMSFTSSGTSHDLLSIDVTTLSAAERQAMAGDLGQVTKNVTASAAQIAGQTNQTSIMQAFNTALSDALTTGIGALVDADMNLVSTRLQALKTQQQLGILALSIANDNARLILKLFGG